MTAPGVDGVSQGGEPTDLEISLLEQASTLSRAGEIHNENAVARLEQTEENIAAFIELVLVENGDVAGLRPQLVEAQSIANIVRESAQRVEDLSTRFKEEANQAKLKLGTGADQMQVHIDNITGTSDITGLLEQIADENEVLNQQADALSIKLTALNSEVEAFRTNQAAAQSLIQDITTAEGFVNSWKGSLDSSGIPLVTAAGENLVLLEAYNALQLLSYDGAGNKKSRPANEILRAIQEAEWADAKVIMADALVLAENEQELAVEQEQLVRGTIGEGLQLTTHLEGYWATEIAPGLFSFDTENNAVGLRPFDDVQDIVTQAGYIELINIIHSIEQMVQEDPSLFSDEEQRQFWGVEKEEIIVGDDGIERRVRRRLTGAEKSVERGKHLEAWERGATINAKGEEIAFTALDEITEINHPNLLHTVRSIALQLRNLKNMASGSSVSPDIAAQLQWVSNISGSFIGALKELERESPGSPLYAAKEEALQKSFNSWIDNGGLNYVQNIKVALQQATLGSEETGAIRLRPSIQDLVFFEYATTGEATLNRQIGQLGDTMKLLTRYLDNLNIVDSLLSKATLPVDHRGKIEKSIGEDSPPWTEDETENFFEALNELWDLWNINAGREADSNGENGVAADVGALNFSQKDSLGKIFSLVEIYLHEGADGTGLEGADDVADLESEEREALSDAVIAAMDNKEGPEYGVGEDRTLTRAEDYFIDIPDVDTGIQGVINVEGDGDSSFDSMRRRLYRLFNDDNFHSFVTNAITHGQSVNDTAKQSLKKTMFVYQEFIKSAGSIMDKVNELIRGIAQKIGR